MMKRLLIRVAILGSLCTYASPRPTGAEEAPKLVLVVAVDQMRRSEIDKLRPHFTGGFRRLLSEGRGSTDITGSRTHIPARAMR